MVIFSKTTTRLAMLALVISAFKVEAQVSQPAAAPVAAPPATVDSKGGAQVSADKHQTAQKVVVAPAVKVAAAKPAVKHVDKHVVAHPVTAPVAVAAAPVEVKKADEPKMSLAITGQFTPEVAFINDSTHSSKASQLQGYNFGWNNAWVQFKGTGKNSSGLAFSGVVRMDAAVMMNEASAISGTTLTMTPRPLVDFNRLYGMVEHENLGTIQFGNFWGPQYLQQLGQFDIFYGGLETLDRPYSPYKFFAAPPGSYSDTASYDATKPLTALRGSNNNGSTDTFAVGDPMRNTKLAYVSPSLGGFKLSGTFSPRLDETGSTFAYPNPALSTTAATGYRIQNSWMIVPSFNKKFGDVQIGLMGTYGGGTIVNSDGTAATDHSGTAALGLPQDPKLWNIAGGIKTMGFELGGLYTNSGVSGLTTSQSNAGMDAGYGWNVAAAYNFEKAKIGAIYMVTNRTLSASDIAQVTCFTFYADYKVAPGVKILLSENYLKGNAATSLASAHNLFGTAGTIGQLGANTTSNVLFLGLDVTF